MTRKNLLVAAAVTGALAVFAAGCLGSDPNMNSQIYNATPDAAGVGGSGNGAGGGGGSGGSDPDRAIVGAPVATFDTDGQGFVFSNYNDPNDTNLAVKNNGTSPTLQFDA